MECIIPSSDLRNRYPEVSRRCKESNKPIYITVNGRGDTVLLSMEYYEQLEAEIELLKMFAASEKDIAEGRIDTAENAIKRLREKHFKLITM